MYSDRTNISYVSSVSVLAGALMPLCQSRGSQYPCRCTINTTCISAIPVECFADCANDEYNTRTSIHDAGGFVKGRRNVEQTLYKIWLSENVIICLISQHGNEKMDWKEHYYCLNKINALSPNHPSAASISRISACVLSSSGKPACQKPPERAASALALMMSSGRYSKCR